VGVATLLAYVLSVVLLSLASRSVVIGMLFAVWTTSPILWWFGWATRNQQSAAMREAAMTIAVVLGPAYLGFHARAWYAIHISSTGAIGYLTLPFLLLILTIAATSIAGAAARRGQPRPIRRSPDDEARALARDLARVDAKRAKRSSPNESE
jgi:cytochrome bd-type quinol oxidase subunit 2